VSSASVSVQELQLRFSEPGDSPIDVDFDRVSIKFGTLQSPAKVTICGVAVRLQLPTPADWKLADAWQADTSGNSASFRDAAKPMHSMWASLDGII